ncbi:UNC5C-like protein [Ptychodera flava]|uniref:UNC5C-like protein n=1 Tax=Ptychodera flava TaxID=63121 RepID=UPI00396A7BA2
MTTSPAKQLRLISPEIEDSPQAQSVTAMSQVASDGSCPLGEAGCLPKLLSEPSSGTDALKQRARGDDFVVGKFDHTGGHLLLSFQGVHLFIPPGAIPKDEVREIFMYASRETQHVSQLSDQHGQLISPVVICGPHGSKFESDVILSFHCTGKGFDDIKAVYSATDVDEGCQFVELSDVEGACSLYNDTTGKGSIILRHFTGGAFCGKVNSDIEGGNKKWITLYVFYSEKSVDVKLRVRCTDNSEDNERFVFGEEKMLTGKQCTSSKQLKFDVLAGDVSVSLENIEEGWERFPSSGTNSQIMSREILVEHGQDCCEFIAKRCDGLPQQPTAFRCSLHIKQEGNECFSPNRPIAISLDFATSRQACKSIFTEGTREKMKTLLDPENPIGNDWRKFAEKLDLNGSINYLQSQYPHKSPTLFLLNYWEGNLTNPHSPVAELKDLSHFFRSIQRDDVGSLIDVCLSFDGLYRQSSSPTSESKLQHDDSSDTGYCSSPPQDISPSLRSSDSYQGFPSVSE